MKQQHNKKEQQHHKKEQETVEEEIEQNPSVKEKEEMVQDVPSVQLE
jgi:hypothetical protein